jgi:hypothetical protein
LTLQIWKIRSTKSLIDYGTTDRRFPLKDKFFPRAMPDFFASDFGKKRRGCFQIA